MKRQFYIFLMIATSVFVISLGIIQSIYVKNMVEMRHVIFQGKINDAMTEALQLINKHYAIERKTHFVNYTFHDAFYNKIIEDKSGRVLYKPVSEDVRKKQIKLYFHNNFSDHCSLKFTYESNSKNNKHDIHFTTVTTDPYQSFISSKKQNLSLFNHSDTVLSFLEKRPQFAQQDVDFMDSVLKMVLHSYLLDLDFEFGIYCPYFNQYLVYSNEALLYKISLSGLAYNYKIRNSFVSFPAYFVIYFPLQQQYLALNSTPLIITGIIVNVIVYILFLLIIIAMLQYRRVVKLRDNFVDNMTHEFKTPIVTIGLASEALRDKDILKNWDITENYIKIISYENKRLEIMVETILSNATLNKRMRSTLKMEIVDINLIVEEAVHIMRVVLEQRNGQIIWLKEELPLVQLDKDKMITAIKNILDNAIKYTKEKPIIHIEIARQKKRILIAIKDNGIGIDRRYYRNIFDRLFRIPTGNVHDVKGYGLGLNNVKEIIRSHGGKIKVESKKDKGSTFKLYLPIKT